MRSCRDSLRTEVSNNVFASNLRENRHWNPPNVTSSGTYRDEITSRVFQSLKRFKRAKGDCRENDERECRHLTIRNKGKD